LQHPLDARLVDARRSPDETIPSWYHGKDFK
jgi:hypothetical protein